MCIPGTVAVATPRVIGAIAYPVRPASVPAADADSAGPLRRLLIEACEAEGRDPATMRTTTNALICLDGGKPPARAALAGSAQQIVDQLGRIAEAGYDEFILPDYNLGETLAERSDNLARIKAEVIDQLG